MSMPFRKQAKKKQSCMSWQPRPVLLSLFKIFRIFLPNGVNIFRIPHQMSSGYPLCLPGIPLLNGPNQFFMIDQYVFHRLAAEA